MERGRGEGGRERGGKGNSVSGEATNFSLQHA